MPVLVIDISALSSSPLTAVLHAQQREVQMSSVSGAGAARQGSGAAALAVAGASNGTAAAADAAQTPLHAVLGLAEKMDDVARLLGGAKAMAWHPFAAVLCVSRRP